MKQIGSLLVFPSAEAVTRAAADRFASVAAESIAARGRFSVVLSGGSTPRGTYRRLANDPYARQIDWAKTFIFFGDERSVPPDHPDSNFRMANEALLSRVPIPPGNIKRMAGEGDPNASAAAYEADLRAWFGRADWPRLDLVFLGMGDDGHTASLFPGSAALQETARWVVANWVEKFHTFRITLTLPAINHAARVLFLVTGAGKTERLAQVLNDEPSDAPLPSQLIQPLEGTVEWLVDEAAAPK